MKDEKFNTVSREDYRKFLAEYPRALKRDYSQICEPPMVSYNDFTLGDWPNSVVAWNDDENLLNDEAFRKWMPDYTPRYKVTSKPVEP